MRMLKTKSNVFYVANNVTYEDSHTTIFFFVIMNAKKGESEYEKIVYRFIYEFISLYNGIDSS